MSPRPYRAARTSRTGLRAGRRRVHLRAFRQMPCRRRTFSCWAPEGGTSGRSAAEDAGPQVMHLALAHRDLLPDVGRQIGRTLPLERTRVVDGIQTERLPVHLPRVGPSLAGAVGVVEEGE